jgi:hypothetical protein
MSHLTDLIKLQDSSGVPIQHLARTKGGMIVNLDSKGYAQHKAQMGKMQSTDAELNSLKERLDRIESLLEKLVEKL